MLRVQEELKDNDNGEADFKLDLETAFMVKVCISKKAFVSKDDAKDDAKDVIAVSRGAYIVYSTIVNDKTITREAMALNTGLSTASVWRAITELKQKGVIVRVGGKRYGHWEIIKEISNE